MRLMTFLFLTIFLIGCMSGTDDELESGHALVYVNTEDIRCKPLGLSILNTQDILIEAGIDVIESRCGRKIGSIFFDVCGTGMGQAINLHTILEENIVDAEELGFADVTELGSDTSDGYILTECNEL